MNYNYMFCKPIQYKMLKVRFLFSSITYIDILFVLVHIEYKVELDTLLLFIFLTNLILLFGL